MGFFNYSSAAAPNITLSTSLGSVSPGSTGTVVISSISGLPTRFPFTLIAEWNTTNAEVITVTQAATGTGPFTFANCIRGDDNTSAPAHNSGVSITHGPSARDYYQGGQDWLNVLKAKYGADPSGSADSTAAIQAALNDCSPGQCAYLPVGTYKVSSPIVIPPQVGLVGTPATMKIAQGPTGGSVLMPTVGFSAGTWPLAAVILIVDQTTGSYSVQSQEQQVRDIQIQGSNLGTSTAIHGVGIYSGVSSTGQTTFENMLIVNMSGWGFTTPNGTGQTRAFNVNVRNCGLAAAVAVGGGFQLQCSDSNFLFCESNSNTGDGWNILNTYDSVFNQCHSEHNGDGGTLTSAYGFNYKSTNNNSSPTLGSISFVGCTVDAGQYDGFYFTSTSNPAPPINVVGGFSRRPGTKSSSAGYAGYRVDGYKGPINFCGVQCYPGQPDGGGSNFPQWGLNCTNNGANTQIAVTGSVLNGVSGGINCDGTQGLLTIGADCTFGTGVAAGTVLYVPGVTLQAASSTELLPVDRTLYTQPTGTLGTSIDRAIATTSITPVSGTPVWRLASLVAGVPITSVNTWVTGTAKAGGTHGWCAIVSVATGKVVAVSADNTDAATTWGNNNAVQVINLTAQYIPPVSGAYWLVVDVNATTMPTLAAGAALDTNLANRPPILCGTGAAGQTTPPTVGSTPTAPSSVAADNILIWVT